MQLKVLSNLSIRDKLVGIILVSTLLSLAIGFTVVIRSSLRQFEEDLLRTTETIATAVGNYTALALAFDDKEESAKALEPVRQLEEVTDVYLFSLQAADRGIGPGASGEPRPIFFDGFTRNGSIAVPELIVEEHTELRDGFVHCFRPVVFFGERYGIIYVRASAESLERRVQGFLLFMAVLAAILTVVAGGIAWVLQGVISKPILELAEAARRVSEEADYSVRVEKPGDDEIGALYDGFNAMLDQIQERQQELERSNRELDQFARVASHDLKAPLRAISTLAGWLEEDLDTRISEESKEQLRLMRSRVERMDTMIDGILEYSRAGRRAGSVETVDVAALVHDLVDVLAPPESMAIEIDPSLPVLATQRLPLEQVFLNLIGNALKYHHRPSAGHIRLGGERRGEVYRFSVADDGPGIDPKYHERVFVMFQTLHRRDEVESTGLGLTLVKKLVEEEGGRVVLDSEEGRGANFFFTWPASEAGRVG
ncbi:MAG: ATP-binding protein [Holophagales bacterium]|nr:ATP-binding protein [Holophagales bacterium]